MAVVYTAVENKHRIESLDTLIARICAPCGFNVSLSLYRFKTRPVPNIAPHSPHRRLKRSRVPVYGPNIWQCEISALFHGLSVLLQCVMKGKQLIMYLVCAD